MVSGDCGCGVVATEAPGQRRVLRIAMALNAAMFVIGLIAGLTARSSGLIADSLDMLADASAYAIALVAIGKGSTFRANAGLLSGSLLLLLGIGVLVDVARRAIGGSEPQGLIVIATAFVSLVVNATVLRMMGRFRQGEAHLRATWLFTRVDVIANLAVITSGLLILLTGFRFLDLVVGAGIGLYVIKEAVEIVGEARGARVNRMI